MSWYVLYGGGWEGKGGGEEVLRWSFKEKGESHERPKDISFHRSFPFEAFHADRPNPLSALRPSSTRVGWIS
jgi:hypothetical protein